MIPHNLIHLKVLYKKYGCLSFSEWWVDARAIDDGSFAQGIEDDNYSDIDICDL